MKNITREGPVTVTVEPCRNRIQFSYVEGEQGLKEMAKDYLQTVKIQLALAGVDAKVRNKFYRSKFVTIMVFNSIEDQNVFNTSM